MRHGCTKLVSGVVTEVWRDHLRRSQVILPRGLRPLATKETLLHFAGGHLATRFHGVTRGRYVLSHAFRVGLLVLLGTTDVTKHTVPLSRGPTRYR